MSDENIENANSDLNKTMKSKAAEQVEQKTTTKSDSKLKNSTQVSPVKTPSLFSGVLSLVSVITFLGLGILGYFSYLQLQKVSDRISYLEQQEKNSQSEVSNITTDLNQKFQQLQRQLQQDIVAQSTTSSLKIDNIAKQLSTTQRQVQSVNGRHQSDWLLAEADYLVRIASNRLLLERDVTTALSLLQSADERILLMDDSSLQPARDALARDMAVLRTIQKEDLVGIASRLSALMPQLKNLTIMSFQLPEETVEDANETILTETDWFESLKNTFKELSVKWFEVRDHGRPVKPLMNREQESVILTNIAFLLQNAQYATLRQHPDLYKQSLTQLQEWLVEYFDIADPAVSAFVTEIKSLNAMSIRTNLPESLESRLVISRQMEKRLAKPSMAIPELSNAERSEGEVQ